MSVGYDGSGIFRLHTDLWTLSGNDQRNIIGKNLVVHELFEDFAQECDPLHSGGHAHFNAKVACGMILTK